MNCLGDMKPNCNKCIKEAARNPEKKFCGYCGAESYTGCVCDVMHNHFAKVRADIRKHGGIGSGNSSVSFGFTCPIHGYQFS